MSPAEPPEPPTPELCRHKIPARGIVGIGWWYCLLKKGHSGPHSKFVEKQEAADDGKGEDRPADHRSPQPGRDDSQPGAGGPATSRGPEVTPADTSPPEPSVAPPPMGPDLLTVAKQVVENFGTAKGIWCQQNPGLHALADAIAAEEARRAAKPTTRLDLFAAAKQVCDRWEQGQHQLPIEGGPILRCDVLNLQDAVAAEEARRIDFRRAGAPVAAPAERPCPRCRGHGRCCPEGGTCAARCGVCGGTGKVPDDSGSARGAGEGGALPVGNQPDGWTERTARGNCGQTSTGDSRQETPPPSAKPRADPPTGTCPECEATIPLTFRGTILPHIERGSGENCPYVGWPLPPPASPPGCGCPPGGPCRAGPANPHVSVQPAPAAPAEDRLYLMRLTYDGETIPSADVVVGVTETDEGETLAVVREFGKVPRQPEPDGDEKKEG